jgi:hypothetical protein
MDTATAAVAALPAVGLGETEARHRLESFGLDRLPSLSRVRRSIAVARVDGGVLAGRVSVIADAPPQIISMPLLGLRAPMAAPVAPPMTAPAAAPPGRPVNTPPRMPPTTAPPTAPPTAPWPGGGGGGGPGGGGAYSPSGDGAATCSIDGSAYSISETTSGGPSIGWS